MRTPQRIALIGYGAVSQAVLRHFADHQMEVLCVLLRPGWREKQRAGLPVPLRFLDDVGEMLSLSPIPYIRALFNPWVALGTSFLIVWLLCALGGP